MATSTRRTFSSGYDGPSTSDSVQLSPSAETRALATQAEGLQAEQTRRDEAARRAQQTAYYRGQGNYSSLGGEPSGYRPRGTATSGGVPIGQRVPAGGGIMGGMPAAGEGDRAALLALTERVAGVARERGPQVGTARPTPNLIDESNEATNVAARYPQDRYYQTTTGQTWQWVPTTDLVPGYWEVAAEVDTLVVGIESPAAQHYPALINNALPRRPEAFTVANYLPDGTTGSGGAINLLIGGAPAVLGETVVEFGGLLSVEVTDPGTGILIVTIDLRQV